MKKMGGNVIATIEVLSDSENEIGEVIQEWNKSMSLIGWLDYSGGSATYTKYAKLDETTHVFICDYKQLTDYKSNDKRMIINGIRYEILNIDNPMELNYQLEFQLKKMDAN